MSAMNRASFLRQAGLTVAALSFGRLPAAAAAAPPPALLTFPEGTFVLEDGFELRIIRDSVLNVTNDWQIFAER